MKLLTAMTIGASLLFGSVDINTANKAELMNIKGIGEKKADAVLEYRKDHCFKSVEDLTSVKGFGSKFIEKNKKELTTTPCKTK